jgi:hypothetical protein
LKSASPSAAKTELLKEISALKKKLAMMGLIILKRLILVGADVEKVP